MTIDKDFCNMVIHSVNKVERPNDDMKINVKINRYRDEVDSENNQTKFDDMILSVRGKPVTDQILERLQSDLMGSLRIPENYLNHSPSDEKPEINIVEGEEK